jgi:hypothetical protein
MSLSFFDIIKEMINALTGIKSPPITQPPVPIVTSPQPDPVAPAPDPVPVPEPVVNLATGSIFIKENLNLMGAVREANILKEFQFGHIPNFMNQWAYITVTIGANTIVYGVLPDFLSIGTDDDYVRCPMNPHTAQAIADMYGFSLITRKMSNDIWKQAVNKLPPRPWGPPYDQDMEKTHRIGTHSQTIQNQLNSAGLNPHALTSGHKKDVVLTNALAPNNPRRRVAIY